MTSIKQTLLSFAFVAAGCAAFQAQASIQWSFTIDGCTPDDSTVGNACSFDPVASTVPAGDTVLGANVSAWSNTGTGGALEAAIMRDHGSNGAGVRYSGTSGTETSSPPQHAMDNDGQLEFMLFDFQGQDVNLTDVTLGYSSNDSDLSILAWAGGGAPDLTANSITGNSGTPADNTEDLTGTGGWISVAQINNAADDSTFDFSSLSNGITSSYWLVGAYAAAFGGCNINGDCDPSRYPDYVKLWDVGGDIPDTPTPPDSSVPAPATALLLAGMLPLLRRRRR